MNDYISRKDVLNLVRIGYLVSNSNSRKIVDHINAIPAVLTESDLQELEDRFGAFVRFVVEDMLSGKGERWENT